MSLATRAANRLRELYINIWRRNKLTCEQEASYHCNCRARHARHSCALSQPLEPRLMFSAAPCAAADPAQELLAEEVSPPSEAIQVASLQADFSPASAADVAESPLTPLTAVVDPSVLSYEDNGNGITITDCPTDASGELKIPDVIDGKAVNAIGDFAFDCCGLLTSVEIPSTVTTIGEEAFFGCESLESIIIGDCVTVIGDRAFYWCDSLTSIDIPDSVAVIGSNAFCDCNKLLNVKIGSSVTTLGERAFFHCDGLIDVTFGSSITTIGPEAFSYCTSIASVNLPVCLETIDDMAFYMCYRLTIANIPENVTEIGDKAFYRCSLTNVEMGNNVATIGHNAFYGCKLTSVDIGSGVINIGESAFNACYFLESINVSADNAVYASNNGVLFSKDMTTLIQYPCGKNGDYAIADGVSIIGNSSFYNCRGLASIEIPDSIMAIGDCAFYGCNSLDRIEIPANVVAIGDLAFGSSESLVAAIFNGDAPASFGSDVFSDAASGFNIYFYQGTSGFTIPTWKGYVCVQLVDPSIFSYVENNGTITITDCLLEIDGELLIPDTIDGKPVATIGEEAFQDCCFLTKVIIPSTVTVIEAGAFGYCSVLKCVNLPDSVIAIGDNAFYKCGSLANIDLPDNMTTIGKATFYGCTELKSVAIGSQITVIEDEAFYDCQSLASIMIPDSVNRIGILALAHCYSLDSIDIGAGVVTIEELAFGFCIALKEINVFSENIVYASLDGVLFSKDMGMLIQFPASKAGMYVVPASVTAIGENAFYECTSLMSVEIPDSVTSIGDEAFCSCSSLTTVTFEADAPDSLGLRMFHYTASDLTIHYHEGASGFTTPAWQGYPCEMIGSGDANEDGVVDLDDFIILKQNYGVDSATWSQGDFNFDGVVDLDDFIILKQNYGVGA